MSEDNKYLDLPPDTLGELKEIKRIPGMQPNDKRGRKKMRIHWGKDYQLWSVEKRLRFAEDLAASMNNAADVLQQERRGLIDLVQKQEELLKSWPVKYAQQGDLLQSLMIRTNTEKQSRLTEMQELKAELRKAKKRIEELE